MPLERISEGCPDNPAAWRRPWIPLFATITVGMAWARFWPLPAAVAVLFSGISLLLLWASLQPKRTFSPLFFSRLLPLITFLAAGHLTGLCVHHITMAENELYGISDISGTIVTGIITGLPEEKNHGIRTRLSLVEIENKNRKTVLKGDLRLTVVGAGALPLPGVRVTLSGKIKTFHNFNNPGGFDYKRFQLDQGVIGRIWCHKEALRVGDGVEMTLPLRIDRLRLFLSGQIRSAAGDPDVGSVLCAMLIGDRSGMDRDLRQAWGRAGAGHLLAISGLHVGIVCGVVFFLFDAFCRRIPFLLSRGWSRKAAAFPASLAAISYGLISGGAPSALRALLMVLAGFFVLVTDRRTDPWSLLVFAASVLLLAAPERIGHVGFWLSVTAVGGLVLGFHRFPEKATGKRHGVKTLFLWFVRLFKASLFAGFATMPLQLFVFYEVPLFGIIANLVLVPAMAMVAVPLGLSALVAGTVSTGLGHGLLGLSAGMVDIANGLVLWMGDESYATLRPGALTLLEVLLFYAALFLTVTRLAGEKHTKLLFFFGFLIFLDTGRWVRELWFLPHPVVTILDVGQGSAAVVRFPEGKTMVVDGGGFPWKDAMDTGRVLIAPWLYQRKIRTIDIMVVSHPDQDHIGGLHAVATLFRVKELWISDAATIHPQGAKLIHSIREKGGKIRRIPANGGLTSKDWAGGRLTVFEPEKGAFSGANNHSIVLQVAYGKSRLLFCGDIEKEAETYYTRRFGNGLASTGLVVPHHGSNTSSGSLFLSAVSPEIAVISCGYKNRYGYPHPSVLRRLTHQESLVFRTNRGGAVTLHLTPSGITGGYTPMTVRDRLW